jgi:IS30 family transposase
MKTYKRLTLEDREEISRLLALGYIPGAIARILDRHRSTLTREIAKGRCNRYTYRAVRAEQRAVRNARKRKKDKRKIALSAPLRNYVFSKLRLRWSPEQIARTIVLSFPDNPVMRISPETIYCTLYALPKGALKKELLSCLRRSHKQRRQKGRTMAPGKPLEHMTLIDARPEEVSDRRVPGHWEGDLIIGKNRQSALGTLSERTIRFTLLIPLKNKSAEHVSREFSKRLNRLPVEMRKTLTYDQGREMADHETLARRTKIRVFFAHKASPWERGTNENTNGLIRQFFPKGTDFLKVSRREILRVEKLLNNRPRKVLQWRSPNEVFHTVLR